MDIQGSEIYTDGNTIFIDNETGTELEDVGADEQIPGQFDPSRIRVNTKTLSIDLLRSRLENDELDLAPDFQRKGGIWKDEAQSRLIESMLVRIPLPAFYMDATDDDKWLVVDGLQRLTTMKRFMVERVLRLRGLEFLKQFDGKSFDELPRNYQRRITETQVTVYLIEKGTPDGVKFNIYKRINTGGLPLSSQEIRHALYQGKATQMLIRLAGSTEFKTAIDNGIKDDRMADRECVLRYLAFTITSYMQYDGDFDGFLNTAMKSMNSMSDLELEKLADQFIRVMKIATSVFGKDAFRKRYRESAPRLPINKPLFESWSVNFNQLNDEQVERLTARGDILRQKFIELVNSSECKFDEAVSQSTGGIKKVRLRFEAIEQLIKEVLV